MLEIQMGIRVLSMTGVSSLMVDNTELHNVLRSVKLVVSGALDDLKYETAVEIELGDPYPGEFVERQNLTEEMVVTWALQSAATMVDNPIYRAQARVVEVIEDMVTSAEFVEHSPVFNN